MKLGVSRYWRAYQAGPHTGSVTRLAVPSDGEIRGLFVGYFFEEEGTKEPPYSVPRTSSYLSPQHTHTRKHAHAHTLLKDGHAWLNDLERHCLRFNFSSIYKSRCWALRYAASRQRVWSKHAWQAYGAGAHSCRLLFILPFHNRMPVLVRPSFSLIGNNTVVVVI